MTICDQNRAIKILRHELGYYQGNFDVLNQQGYTGYTRLYILKKDNPDLSTIHQLIQTDIELGANIDCIVSESWKLLFSVDNGKLLAKLLETYKTDYTKVSQLLLKELGKHYEGFMPKQLKKQGFDGYADYYLALVKSKELSANDQLLKQLEDFYNEI